MNLHTAEPDLAYHRLTRADPRHRWWRPLLVGLLSLALYLVAMLVVLTTLAVLSVAVPGVELATNQFLDGELDAGDPVTFALMLTSLILLLPALLVATRLVGSRPVGLLSSVAGRLRARWLRTTLVLALAVWLPPLAVWVAIEAGTGTLELRRVAPATSLVLLALTLALVPLQAAAEEYVFRGYLAQLVGSWLRHPAFAILAPVPLFVLGHGYGPLATLDVAAFAVMCGWLAWRTGGLEAPIAAHVVNNVLLMSLSAVGVGDPNATETSPIGLAVSLVTMVVFTVVVARVADRDGVARTRPLVDPLVPDERPAPIQGPARVR